MTPNETDRFVMDVATHKETLQLVFRGGKVVKAPKFLSYMVDNEWGYTRVVRYCLKRGWKIDLRPNGSTTPIGSDT